MARYSALLFSSAPLKLTFLFLFHEESTALSAWWQAQTTWVTGRQSLRLWKILNSFTGLFIRSSEVSTRREKLCNWIKIVLLPGRTELALPFLTAFCIKKNSVEKEARAGHSVFSLCAPPHLANFTFSKKKRVQQGKVSAVAFYVWSVGSQFRVCTGRGCGRVKICICAQFPSTISKYGLLELFLKVRLTSEYSRNIIKLLRISKIQLKIHFWESREMAFRTESVVWRLEFRSLHLSCQAKWSPNTSIFSLIFFIEG